MPLTLYHHPLSSFCHKVLVALYENGTEFERRVIDLSNPADRADLQALWPFCKFPVLRDHARQRGIAETTVIIEYLDRFFPGPRPLVPEDWEAAHEVRLWDRIFDNYVQVPMQAIVGDRMRGANADMSRERATLQTAYGMIERQLAGRPWVCGEHFSMADCAAAPALFYASTLEAFPAASKHLPAYFDRLVDHPPVKRVLEEAKPFFHFYPFADAIPQRFR